ncbi:ABC transporter substrate-binding protein [Siculibacillus lacustris]|nr:ABC transporter substrate-binding protein [Siculibacillus lacustris]
MNGTRRGIDRRRVLGLAGAIGGLAAFGTPAIAARREIQIGTNYGLPFLPFIVAEKLQLFDAAARDAGIGDVAFSVRRFGVATALIDAILSGNVQLGTLGSQALLNAYEKTRTNVGFKGVSAYWKGVFPIFSNVPEIRSLKDIRPTDKIAVQGPKSAQALYLKRAAEVYFGEGNAGRFDNQIVVMGHADAVPALTKSKAIQVYVSISPFAEIVAAQDGIHRIATSRDFADASTTNAFLGSIESFVAKNPDIHPAVIAALDRANAFILENPADTTRFYLEAEPSALPLDQVRAIVEANKAEYATRPAGLLEASRFLNRIGEMQLKLDTWREVFFAPVRDGEGS